MSTQVCAEHLVEKRQVGNDTQVAAWATCEIVQHGEGRVNSGWSGPVLITGRVTSAGYEPQSMVQPRDGEQYAPDVRRMFSSAAAAEMLQHRDYGLTRQLELEIKATR